MDKFSEVRVEHRGKSLIIELPRIPGRSTLRMCRARAKVIAAREGIRTEQVAPFTDGLSGESYPKVPRGGASRSTRTGRPLKSTRDTTRTKHIECPRASRIAPYDGVHA